MGSRAPDSIRARARSAKRYPTHRGKNHPTETPQPQPGDLAVRLHETRSILAVATMALDEIADPHRMDVTETCGTGDVANVLRLGIGLLNEARDALDASSREDVP
jgi:hypothetical protein